MVFDPENIGINPLWMFIGYSRQVGKAHCGFEHHVASDLTPHPQVSRLPATLHILECVEDRESFTMGYVDVFVSRDLVF
ncbi:hypothetical protein D3C80_1754840 [compost metagenome]